MSKITTHVLDTAKGKPAEGVQVQLYRMIEGEWDLVVEGKTNADGRIPEFSERRSKLPEGLYRIYFNTLSYFSHCGEKGFYPYVDVVFELASEGNYHVPLLLSPFGYSTYRGS